MKPQLLSLTGVRFFLAFYVLLFHNVNHFGTYRMLSIFLLDGYSAVSAFFLLSGLIMSYNYDSFSSSKKIYSFYIARFARIYPLYFLSLIIDLPLFVYFIFKTNFNEWQVKTLSIFCANLFMIQTWNVNWLGVLNSPGWSLSVELFFYLLFPFAVNFFNKISQKKLAFFFLILYLIICLELPFKFITDIYCLIEIPINPNAHPLVHLPTFLCGIILGKVLTSKSFQFFFKTHYLLSNALTILPLIILFWLSQIGISKIYNINNGLYIPLYTSLFLGIINEGSLFKRILSTKWFTILGHISYGIYLLQIPIRKWLDIFYKKAGCFSLDSYVFFMPYLIILFILSYFLYLKFEIKAQLKIKLYLTTLIKAT